MAITLPAYCRLQFDGFKRQRASGVERSEMEAGPTKQLQTTSSVLVTVPVTILIDSNADYLAFLTWFKVTHKRGGNWFDWNDPMDGVTKSTRIAGGLDEEKPDRKTMDYWRIVTKFEFMD
jgi:hypothetical protein